MTTMFVRHTVSNYGVRANSGHCGRASGERSNRYPFADNPLDLVPGKEGMRNMEAVRRSQSDEQNRQMPGWRSARLHRGTPKRQAHGAETRKTSRDLRWPTSSGLTMGRLARRRADEDMDRLA